MEKEPKPVKSVILDLAQFALDLSWDDLPPSIARETKHILMDSIGCALGASTTDKGKMNVALARRLGGPPDASIIGLGGKVSCTNAALANGELILTLDFSNIMGGGHDGAYVIPAVLATAESVGASGRDLILSTAMSLRSLPGLRGPWDSTTSRQRQLNVRAPKARVYRETRTPISAPLLEPAVS